MKKIVISLMILMLLPLFVRAETADKTNNAELLYPELPMASEYKHVAEMLTDHMIEQVPDAKDRRSDILDYVYSQMSVSEFEKQMMHNYYPLLHKGHLDEAFRKNGDYQAELARCQSTSKRMAVMVVAFAHGVYLRKYLRLDDLTRPLFEKSESYETDQVISWINKEVSESEMKSALQRDIKLEPGDKIYSYSTSDFSWKMEFGRYGYAIFRDGKLVENVVKMVN